MLRAKNVKPSTDTKESTLSLFLALHAFAGTHDEAALRGWLRLFVSRFFDQQYKRSMAPDGPKVALEEADEWKLPAQRSLASGQKPREGTVEGDANRLPAVGARE